MANSLCFTPLCSFGTSNKPGIIISNSVPGKVLRLSQVFKNSKGARSVEVKATGNDQSTKRNSLLCADCEGNAFTEIFNVKPGISKVVSRSMSQIVRHLKDFSEVQAESESEYHTHGNCTKTGFTSTLPEMGYLDLKQNDVKELVLFWEHFSLSLKNEFTKKYGDIAMLLYTRIDFNVIRAAIRFWDPTYKCFMIGQEDLTPTLEEYTSILRLEVPEAYPVFTKAQRRTSIQKVLKQITGIETSDQSEYLIKKGDIECIRASLFLSLLKKDPLGGKAMDTLALAIYGLVVFSKSLGHIDSLVIEFFSRLDQHVNPIPTILAETIKSLCYCRQKGTRRFIGCASLLYIWIMGHTQGERKSVVWLPQRF